MICFFIIYMKKNTIFIWHAGVSLRGCPEEDKNTNHSRKIIFCLRSVIKNLQWYWRGPSPQRCHVLCGPSGERPGSIFLMVRLNGNHRPTYTPVHFLHSITVNAMLACSSECCWSKHGCVYLEEGEEKKERSCRVPLQKNSRWFEENRNEKLIPVQRQHFTFSTFLWSPRPHESSFVSDFLIQTAAPQCCGPSWEHSWMKG